jgi:hypothetical protein
LGTLPELTEQQQQQQQVNGYLRAEAPTYQPVWGESPANLSLMSPTQDDQHKQSPILSLNIGLHDAPAPKALPPTASSPHRVLPIFGQGAFGPPQHLNGLKGISMRSGAEAPNSPLMQQGSSSPHICDDFSAHSPQNIFGNTSTPPSATGSLNVRNSLSEHDLLSMAGSLLETCVYKERQ